MDDINKTRSLASRSKESGAWLHALSISAMGLWLEDDSLRIAVGLCLGTAPCCVAPINANIVEMRWMLWAGMGLAVGGLRGDITDTPL